MTIIKKITVTAAEAVNLWWDKRFDDITCRNISNGVFEAALKGEVTSKDESLTIEIEEYDDPYRIKKIRILDYYDHEIFSCGGEEFDPNEISPPTEFL